MKRRKEKNGDLARRDDHVRTSKLLGARSTSKFSALKGKDLDGLEFAKEVANVLDGLLGGVFDVDDVAGHFPFLSSSPRPPNLDLDTTEWHTRK